VQQDVVERFAAEFGRIDEHTQVLDHLLLSAEVAERERSECLFELALAGSGRKLFASNVESIVFHHNTPAKIMLSAHNPKKTPPLLPKTLLLPVQNSSPSKIFEAAARQNM